MFSGCVTASRESFKNVLRRPGAKGIAAVLPVGGSRELLTVQSKDAVELVILSRKGFVREALKSGAYLGKEKLQGQYQNPKKNVLFFSALFFFQRVFADGPTISQVDLVRPKVQSLSRVVSDESTLANANFQRQRGIPIQFWHHSPQITHNCPW